MPLGLKGWGFGWDRRVVAWEGLVFFPG